MNLTLNIVNTFEDIYQAYTLLWKPQTWKMTLRVTGILLIILMSLDGFKTFDVGKALIILLGLLYLFVPYTYFIKLSAAFTYFPAKLLGKTTYVISDEGVLAKKWFFSQKIKWSGFKNGARSERYIALMKPFYLFPLIVHVLILSDRMVSQDEWKKIHDLIDEKEVIHADTTKFWKKFVYWLIGSVTILLAELNLFLIFTLFYNPTLKPVEPDASWATILVIAWLFLALYLHSLLYQFAYSFKKGFLTFFAAILLQIILVVLLVV